MSEPTSSSSPSSTGNLVFEKQRDLLLGEISSSIDSVVYNLEILNRSLNLSVQVGKEFDNVGRLWNLFYDGIKDVEEAKEAQRPESNE